MTGPMPDTAQPDSRLETLVQVEKVRKKFCRSLDASLRYGLRDVACELLGRDRKPDHLRAGEYWAVKDVSFSIRRGEGLALIGRNGAGKSTLLRLIGGRLKLDGGWIRTRGRIASITEVGTGFDPTQTGLENIFNAAAVLGISVRQTRRLIDEVIDFAELREFIDTPVQSYSTGMKARLGFAVAAQVRPDILLVDEALAVGDVAFRRKCLNHMSDYLRRGGSLVVVSHDLYSMQCVSSRCLVLERGSLVFDGAVEKGIGLLFELLKDRPASVVGLPASVPGEPSPRGSVDGEDGPSLAVAGEAVPGRGDPARSVPIRIDGLRIEPLEGTALRTGHPARVTVAYTADAFLEPVTWAFTLCTADQLIRIGTGFRDRALRGVRIPAGSGTLTCVMPRLPLRPGRYALKAAIVSAETGILLALRGWEDVPCMFEVASLASYTDSIHALAGDLVEVAVEWED